MQLPDPTLVQPEFLRRGFVVVGDALDLHKQTALCDVALALVKRRGANVDRTNAEKRLRYRVVAGDRIAAEGKPLFELYTRPAMLSWVRGVTGSSWLAPSPHLRSAININCLQSSGDRYPWHRDAVPHTVVLFLTSVPASAGGTFLIRAADEGLARVQPRAGSLVLMDGTRCEHAVAPLTADILRLSVPMVYPASAIERPAGLDEYLYGDVRERQLS